MKQFTLTREHIMNESASTEIEACVEAMLLLKETDRLNSGAILALLTAYLQLPIDDIDPEQKDEIAEVCTNLGKVFESVRMSHLNFKTNG